MSPAVFCVVDSSNQAIQILEDLRDSGLANYDVSVLCRTSSHSASMADALDWLAGHETMTISALGAVIAAGPIMATLSDMRLSSAANRLAGALMDIGVSKFDARQYERSLRSGDILIAVHSDDGESDDLALQIFDSNHASHICTTAPAMANAGC